MSEERVFARDSLIWRVTRERILLLGGPAAAILQVAHPEVAFGVAGHSNFRRDTVGRLVRTLDAVYAITFATRAEAEVVAERVRRIHAKVRGDTPQPYSAFSPDAQMWVLATLIALSVEVFERFVAPLTESERAAFHRDMRVFGEWFGLSPAHGPQDWAEFSAYYAGMMESLGGLPVSAELARHIAFPRRPFIARAAWPLTGCFSRAFVPEPVRSRLGLGVPAGLPDGLIRRVLRLLPPALRFVPQYRRALRGE